MMQHVVDVSREYARSHDFDFVIDEQTILRYFACYLVMCLSPEPEFRLYWNDDSGFGKFDLALFRINRL